MKTRFTNGLYERLNHKLLNKMRCKVNEKGKKKLRTTIVHECVNKYTIHSVMGCSPSYYLYGTDVTVLPNEI